MDKVLIVDDDALPRAIMGDALRSRRYGIFEAVDAVEAEAVLRREDITVVLLDVVLPGQSGIDFLPRVREISPSTLTVLVTAHPSFEVAIQALRLGAFDFLKKPFEPEELVHIVEKAAHFRRVTQENLVLAKALGEKAEALKGAEKRASDLEERMRSLFGEAAGSGSSEAHLRALRSDLSRLCSSLLEEIAGIEGYLPGSPASVRDSSDLGCLERLHSGLRRLDLLLSEATEHAEAPGGAIRTPVGETSTGGLLQTVMDSVARHLAGRGATASLRLGAGVPELVQWDAAGVSRLLRLALLFLLKGLPPGTAFHLEVRLAPIGQLPEPVGQRFQRLGLRTGPWILLRFLPEMKRVPEKLGACAPRMEEEPPAEKPAGDWSEGSLPLLQDAARALGGTLEVHSGLTGLPMILLTLPTFLPGAEHGGNAHGEPPI